MRIKNIELGYNLPIACCSSALNSAAHGCASAFNLATFSKVKDFDPEGQSESAQFYPQQQIFNLGVNLKFKPMRKYSNIIHCISRIGIIAS